MPLAHLSRSSARHSPLPPTRAPHAAPLRGPLLPPRNRRPLAKLCSSLSNATQSSSSRRFTPRPAAPPSQTPTTREALLVTLQRPRRWTPESDPRDRRSEEHSLNSSHVAISYAVFCLKKKKSSK